MRIARTKYALIFLCCLIVPACHKKTSTPPDHPRLTPGVTLRDVTFVSASLGREMEYRVILPATIPANRTLPAVYLLHGSGGSFRDWSNYSDVAHFAADGLILVMPEGNDSYYTNAVDRPNDRYEDYIVRDLIADVERKFPVTQDRSERAIAGVSMGGFGAVKLSLKHPELFSFAAGLSPALDVPSRPFSIKRIGQYRAHAAIFGAWGSRARHDNDPFALARTVDVSKVPFLYLTCGDEEGLLTANRQFAALLEQRRFHYEFHTRAGSHDWKQWNGWLQGMFDGLLLQLKVYELEPRVDHGH